MLRLEQLAIVCHISVVTVDFQAIFIDVLVRNVVLMALTSALLPVFLYLLNTLFFCMLRVLVVFGLKATLICSLI